MSGIQQSIRLIFHVIRTKIEISPVTQQSADTATFFVKITDIELFARCQQRTSSPSLHDSQRTRIETSVINRINIIRVFHVNRITYACFQAVFLVRQSLITDRTIKVSIIVQQISTHLGTYLRINSRNEYGRIGSKSIKEPAPESFLIMNQTVVSPHFKRDRNESQHLCTGSLFERSIQFCQGIVRQRCLRTVFNNSFRSGIKHFSFGQMFGRRTSSQKQHYQTGLYGAKKYMKYLFTYHPILISFINQLLMCFTG